MNRGYFMDTEYLYVVLARSNTILSRLIHVIKEDEYTHAALSLDRDLEYMFSFGRRSANNPFIGCFKRERLDEGLYAHCPAVGYKPFQLFTFGRRPQI